MRVSFPLLFVLHAAPALLSVFVFGLFPLWLASALLLPLLIALIAASSFKSRRIFACLLSWLAALGTVSLLTAIYLQGEGFNDRFFYHFNIESLIIGFDAYPGLIYGAASYMAACLILPWFLPREFSFKSMHHKAALPVIGLTSLFLFPPVVSAGAHIMDSYQRHQNGDVRILREYRDVEVEPLDARPKNLILIYAESLERLYFDEAVFPGLMKNLNPLRSKALEFTNTQQVDGTGWTMAGIVASQCSLPFNIQYYDGQEAHVGLAAIEEPFKNEICLGDILDAYGYETVFMGGAPLFFAGKGSFLSANGFDQALGFDELKKEVPDYYLYRNGWGFYDDTLVGLAEKKIDTLTANEDPFLLSVLTVDTHQPSGHIPKDCEPYSEDNAILHAVHCNDRILGDFIGGLLQRDDLDDTLIVLFSDHLALRNTAWDRFKAKGDERRLSWMVWGKDIPASTNAAAATHFDVTPTLLEMMGIPNYRENNWGRSVLSGEDGYWFSNKEEERKLAEQVSYLDMEGQSAKAGLKIDSETKTLSIGKKTFKASRAGFSMNDTIFMLLMDPSGAVDAIVFAADLEQFNRVAKDYIVVAVSLDNAIAPGALLPPVAPVDTELQDLEIPEGKENSPEQAAKVTAEPLYYYIGTPSKGDNQAYAFTGVTQGEVSFTGRQMRRALKQKRLK